MVFKLGHSGKPIKIPLQFRNMVLEKDGDQLDPYYKATGKKGTSCIQWNEGRL